MLLGERLLELRLVRRAQLGQALQAQHLYGARLGTNLVQLGFIDLDALATALGAHLAVPVAVETQFESSRESVLARLPPLVAAQWLAVPIGESKGGTLVVGMVNPCDPAAVAAVERAVGGRVQACVAPELRVHYWLEKHYGVPRDPRFLRGAPAGVPAPTPAGQERRRAITANPPLQPAEAQSHLGRIATVKRAVRRARPSDGPALDITVDARVRSDRALAAIGRVEASQKGEDIGAALCDYLSGEVDCGLLLMVKDEMAMGWRVAPPIDEALAARLALALAVPTAFRVACETGATFRGAPPEEGRSLHERLAALLGMTSARNVLVVPVVSGERVPMLVYAQSHDGSPVPAQVVGDLEAIAEAVSARLGAA
jgi:hypothetical protein